MMQLTALVIETYKWLREWWSKRKEKENKVHPTSPNDIAPIRIETEGKIPLKIQHLKSSLDSISLRGPITDLQNIPSSSIVHGVIEENVEGFLKKFDNVLNSEFTKTQEGISLKEEITKKLSEHYHASLIGANKSPTSLPTAHTARKLFTQRTMFDFENESPIPMSDGTSRNSPL